MKTEIEAKFLDIDSSKLRQTLKQLGAFLVMAERPMIRENFDFPDKRLEKIGGWVRIRNEGDKITLAYKQLNDRSLQGTKEVEVVIDNYDRAKDLLLSIGLISYNVQETKRETWKLNEVEITIDTWPWIPTFCEIEADDELLVKQTAAQLELDWSRALHGSVEVAYQHYFNVTDEEIWSWSEIRFIPIPAALANKRKKL
ncbi:MAG: CYTH domain-containing protein [Candidatus Komeilibacteria bacterium]